MEHVFIVFLVMVLPGIVAAIGAVHYIYLNFWKRGCTLGELVGAICVASLFTFLPFANWFGFVISFSYYATEFLTWLFSKEFFQREVGGRR